ncbi:MAG: DUF4350 domain-containing protein [Arenimonas sp.]
MKRKNLMISLIIAVLTGLCIWYFLANYKRVSHERDLPMQGEARYNPLYALKLSLRAMGQQADSHALIDLNSMKLKSGDTLLLYSPPSGLSESQLDQLIEWVNKGGHLIVRSPGATFLSDDVSIYTKLGVSPGGIEEKCLSFLPVNDKKAYVLCGERFFVEDTEWYSWLHGDEKQGYSLGRMTWGDGTVTVVSNLDFLGNGLLKQNGARQLAYQLLADSMGKGRFHLIYSTNMSPLWLLLLKHGWTLLVPLSILLVAWLIYRSQRFGPLQESPNQDRRALLEHISATGEYMFHRHLAHELHLAVLALFNSKLRRRDPMTAALAGEAQIQALAERTKIDPQKIRQALKPGTLSQKENFLHSVATLIQLRNQL